MKKKIVVFGSFVADLMARSNHLPQKGETVKGSSFHIGAGGKGSNQAIAAKKAGGDVTFVTKIGNDTFGQMALETFRKSGLDVSNIIVDEMGKTGCALIMVDENTSENKIVVVPEACGNIADYELNNTCKLIENAGFVLTQLETNLSSIYKVIDQAADKETKMVLNPAPYVPFDKEYLKKIDYITPNEVEAAQITGIAIDSVENAKTAALKMYEMGVKTVVITWGKNGAISYDGEKYILVKAFPVKVLDTTGAGDAFNGGFITALSEGASLENAMVFASATAGLSVERMGTAVSMPERNEIERFLETHKPEVLEI